MYVYHKDLVHVTRIDAVGGITRVVLKTERLSQVFPCEPPHKLSI